MKINWSLPVESAGQSDGNGDLFVVNAVPHNQWTGRLFSLASSYSQQDQQEKWNGADFLVSSSPTGGTWLFIFEKKKF